MTNECEKLRYREVSKRDGSQPSAETMGVAAIRSALGVEGAYLWEYGDVRVVVKYDYTHHTLLVVMSNTEDISAIAEVCKRRLPEVEEYVDDVFYLSDEGRLSLSNLVDHSAISLASH